MNAEPLVYAVIIVIAVVPILLMHYFDDEPDPSIKNPALMDSDTASQV